MEKKKIDALVKDAIAARKKSYSPYSNYQVGAALLTKTGKIYTGCNIENAAYTPSICAERVAIFKAVSEGESEFEAIAVVTKDGGSPCGVCRQVMGEFMLDALVVIADSNGKKHAEMKVSELLPRAFVPDNLHKE
ncbi:MAG: cytidine deaminase [Anaerolineaceae bacterium]|nr:cytidine deaminase [Anaerolineaceae bacterium]